MGISTASVVVAAIAVPTDAFWIAALACVVVVAAMTAVTRPIRTEGPVR